jgi:hypothetical protein
MKKYGLKKAAKVTGVLQLAMKLVPYSLLPISSYPDTCISEYSSLSSLRLGIKEDEVDVTVYDATDCDGASETRTFDLEVHLIHVVKETSTVLDTATVFLQFYAFIVVFRPVLMRMARLHCTQLVVLTCLLFPPHLLLHCCLLLLFEYNVNLPHDDLIRSVS